MITTNKIYNEKCLDTMARMPDDFVDLVVTSPPYDDIRDYNGYSFEFEKIATELQRVIAVGGVIVWIVRDGRRDWDCSGTSFRQALFFKDLGLKLVDTIIYEKYHGQIDGNNQLYRNRHEYMFVVAKSKPKTINLLTEPLIRKYASSTKSHRRQKDGKTIVQKYNNANHDTLKRSNIWRYTVGYNHSSKDLQAFQHPAIFPEQLAADHIKSWSNADDLVYDPFCGSGTTCKMANILQRRYIGSEISAEYCAIAESRIMPTLL